MSASMAWRGKQTERVGNPGCPGPENVEFPGGVCDGMGNLDFTFCKGARWRLPHNDWV